MKTTITLALSLFSLFAFGQNDFLFDHVLEEKVRDERLIDLLRDVRANPLDTGAMNALNTYLENREVSQGSVRSEELFTGGAEPYIGMHPANPNHLVVSYMEEGSAFEYPVYVTTNGGLTWTRSSFSTSGTLAAEYPGETILGGGDPVFTFDDNGTLHMTWIYLHGMGFNFKAGMFYAYSADGGFTFTVPGGGDHVILDGTLFPATDMLDRQWMAMDNTGGMYDGNVYMSAIYFGGVMGSAGEVVVVKPADSTHFNDFVNVAVPISGQEAAQFGNVKVDPNGVVHLSCMKFNQNNGAGGVVYTRSFDGGATFDPPVQLGTGTTALPNGGNHPVHNRDNSAVSMAQEGDNVYIAWSDFANNDVKGFFVYSNDGGSNWSLPYEFGADLLDTSYYHLMPNVAASSGKVSISWYAVRKADMITHYYMAESNDAGATFSEFANITTATTDFANEGSGFYGDYNTSVRNGCTTYAAWADGRTGNPVLYVGTIDACNLGVSEISPITASFSVDRVYPNPVSGDMDVNLKIYAEDSDVLSFTLFDVNGKQIGVSLQQAVTGEAIVSIPLGGIAAGTYLLKVTNSQGIFATRTLVVNE